MGLLSPEGSEAVVRHDVRGVEVLELGAVGTRISGEIHQCQGTVQIAIVIGRDVGDEVGRLIGTDESVAQLERGHTCLRTQVAGNRTEQAANARSTVVCGRWGPT